MHSCTTLTLFLQSHHKNLKRKSQTNTYVRRKCQTKILDENLRQSQCFVPPWYPEKIECAVVCAVEDVKVRRPACIQQLQDESEPIDDTEDVDKLPQGHVVDEIDSALNDIVVEDLQGHDGDEVLGVLPGDQDQPDCCTQDSFDHYQCRVAKCHECGRYICVKILEC